MSTLKQLMVWSLSLVMCGCPNSKSESTQQAVAVASVVPLQNRLATAAPSTTPPVAEPLLVDGKETGYAFLPGGVLIRTEARECPSLVPRSGDVCTKEKAGCNTDAECTVRSHGFCDTHGFDPKPCSCSYGCVRDSDCAAGEICRCDDPVGVCSPAPCMTSGCEKGVCGAQAHSEGVAPTFACLESPRAN
ncbi:MAG TPA: hypothetical protein VHO25_13600 [Polyangiaceae bacterium]|nr:hypothetical protein [Polyangiaceae bacterium]